jgi:hypothetical protein
LQYCEPTAEERGALCGAASYVGTKGGKPPPVTRYEDGNILIYSALYDRQGERLHTVYLGAAPEYLKSLYPSAVFVGIADGAKSNWDFLGPHIDIDERVLDFYHATQYLARAASAICKDEEQRQQRFDEQCHNLKHKHRSASRILRELEQAASGKLTADQRKDLQECITYFGNHLHQMRYALY